MVYAKNTISEQIADISPKLLQHPTFKDILEVVNVDEPVVVEAPAVEATQTDNTTKAKADKGASETASPTTQEDN